MAHDKYHHISIKALLKVTERVLFSEALGCSNKLCLAMAPCGLLPNDPPADGAGPRDRRKHAGPIAVPDRGSVGRPRPLRHREDHAGQHLREESTKSGGTASIANISPTPIAHRDVARRR